MNPINPASNRDPELEVDYDGFATRQAMVDWWSTAIRKAADAERRKVTVIDDDTWPAVKVVGTVEARKVILFGRPAPPPPPCDLTAAMFDHLFERYNNE